MKEKKMPIGSDASSAYREMLITREPEFVNFNGVYIYGGCDAPPHESYKREEKRTFLAGMAMSQCIEAIRETLWRGGSITEPTMAEQVALMSVQIADAVLEKLEKTKTQKHV